MTKWDEDEQDGLASTVAVRVEAIVNEGQGWSMLLVWIALVEGSSLRLVPKCEHPT